MTDTEMQRRKEICDIAGVADIGELSDGFHTFNGLYEQRMILFAALVKAYKDKAWKSYRHEDGEYCFGGGWFIVGIDTPEGAYTYHYENKYWDMFDCIDLPRAPHWDGHTEADAETRLMSLEPEQRWISAESAQNVPNEDLVSRKTVIEALLRDRQQADALMDKYLKNGYMALRADAKAERNRIEKDIAIIEQLPSAQPTLCGYDIDHLMLIAAVLRKENLPPERVTEALTDIGRIVSIVRDEFEESLRKAVEQCKI